MDFVKYDIIFMVLFTLAVILFLYSRRKNLQKQGWIYLYKTKLGLKLINITAKKYSKILKPLQYVIILTGYLLMIAVIWMIVYSTYIYIRYPIISEVIKAPPIIPLIPYFPQIFSLQSFFPPFYFTYFLIALVIVAVAHEFSHGIIARLNKIKIRSTGFAFLGPILGAFVEQDDKQMNKASKFKQLAILSAGVFANIIMTLLFLAIIWIFFISSFSPSGIIFSDYAKDVISRQDITSIYNTSMDNFTSLAFNNTLPFISIQALNKTYFANPILTQNFLKTNEENFLVYQDSPALHSKLQGAIFQVNKEKITSLQDLSNALSKQKPQDTVKIKTITNRDIKEYELTLSSNQEGKAFLGIAVSPQQKKRTFLSFIYYLTPKINDLITGVHYESKIGDFGLFLFYLLWWIMSINFFVALFNMLPLGILDGGRFFMLSIAGITKSEKAGMTAFKYATWFILALLALMMFRWIFNYF